MLRTRSTPAAAPRRGVILIVVLALLSLMLVLTLALVLYAGSEAESARVFREAQVEQRPGDVPPEVLFSYFTSQLLFDIPDDETGVYSGLRGHSLARNMFGLNYAFGPDGGIRKNAAGEPVDAAGRVLNDVPFNGAGRLRHLESPFPRQDEYPLINYTWFPADNFLRDPERIGPRPGLAPPGAPDNRRPYAGGFNPPYTYPDLNHLFLAAQKADGTVLLPSFHRPWNGFGPLDPGNWRWTRNVDPTLSPTDPLYGRPQPWLKYLVLRPRPVDHLLPGETWPPNRPHFPPPEDAGGDVKNLVGAPGGNDSFWIDLDFPVMVGPDGRKYKALFAPLVLDLDNRVNVNIHGNLRGVNYAAHASHMGLGPWEVNLGRVLNKPPPEWPLLFTGDPDRRGRYGPDRWPHSALPGNVAPPEPPAHSYAPLDFDGSREVFVRPLPPGLPSAQLPLPGTAPTPPFSCFPRGFPLTGYGNGSALERLNHPLLFNPFQPFGPDRTFDPSEMEALLRRDDGRVSAGGSDLFRLCPRNFDDPGDPRGSARRRRLVTVSSFDPDRPGLTPWFWPAGAGAYDRLSADSPSPLPAGPPVPTPAVVPPAHPDSEFGPDGRADARVTALRRLDLNRYLPPYPAPDPRTGLITDAAAFAVAEKARQHMAAEIFECLWKVTGAGNPALLPPPDRDPGRWDALRALAQLAVNIVDYIDSDDYMTPFNWLPGTNNWVFGTELPRVVINEAYVEYANDPNDLGLALRPPRATQLKANVWVELHNPHRDDPPLGGTADLEVPGSTWGGSYRIILARPNNNIRSPANVLGEPAPADVLSVLPTFSPVPGAEPPPAAGVNTRALLPADPALAGGFFGPAGGNKGFYVVGPLLNPRLEPGPFPLGFETLRRPEMSYAAAPSPRLINPSVLLQRLACPYRPHQPNPLLPGFNPYVTTDYFQSVRANSAWVVGGPGLPAAIPVPLRHSWGRRQPYAAHPSQMRRQQPNPELPNQPQHTFFQHNADSTTPGPNWQVAPNDYPPFDWLVHLDRNLVSPMELLHVSAFKPHELTQQFRTGDTDREKFAHRAPWLDEDLTAAETPLSHRLYRALEFLGTHGRTAGLMVAGTTSSTPVPTAALLPPYPNQVIAPAAMSGTTPAGGTWRVEAGCCLVIDRGKANEEVVRVKAVDPRSNPPAWFAADFLLPHAAPFTITPVTVSERVPGKINLNTVWDEETFLALCDANSSNDFRDAVAKALFRRLKASRTVGGDVPGPRDHPFRSLATGVTPADDREWPEAGIQDTLLRFRDPHDPNRLPILAVPGRSNPYQTYELLTKIFNNTTVRSNVFAVWVTVGFFEVIDDTARPVKLGAERGRADNRQVHHRMFAVVDRSVLTGNPGPQPQFDPRVPLPPGFATGPVVPYFRIID